MGFGTNKQKLLHCVCLRWRTKGLERHPSCPIVPSAFQRGMLLVASQTSLWIRQPISHSAVGGKRGGCWVWLMHLLISWHEACLSQLKLSMGFNRQTFKHVFLLSTWRNSLHPMTPDRSTCIGSLCWKQWLFWAGHLEPEAWSSSANLCHKST